MSGRWRERAFREVRNELDRFLNFPINNDLRLGDYGLYDGKACKVDWRGNLVDQGIACPSVGVQHEITETYSTADKVTIQGKLGFNGQHPAAEVAFRKGMALAFRGHRISLTSAAIGTLGNNLATAIRGGLAWDKSTIIVTRIWAAEGFTHLVSGGKNAAITIEATAPGAPMNFNFADASLSLQVSAENSMSYHSVGQAGIHPYFGVHKLRQTAQGWQLYRYNAP